MAAAAIPFLMFAGAAVSAVGAIQQGRAAKAAAQFNESVARENAKLAREQTLMQVRQADRENYLRLGAIRAAQGKSGGAQAGSVLDILADTAAQGEIFRQDVIRRGAIQERNYMNAASLEAFEGRQASRQSYLMAGSELLKGAGSGMYALKRT